MKVNPSKILTLASNEAQEVLSSLKNDCAIFTEISVAILQSIQAGGKIMTCGNGGSAADAMHLAEELLGRYKGSRPPIPAVCLNADSTLLTCVGNDFGFQEIFARQVDGLGKANDLLICFSSSGNSENICLALEKSKEKAVKTVALLGKDGGKARGLADHEWIIGSSETARVQEAHTLILHALLEFIEDSMGY